MVHLILATAVLIAFAGRKKGKIPVMISCFILFLFAALRYMYGNDYPGYLSEYNKIQLGIATQFGEPLFAWLNRIIPSFYLLIAITSLFFVVVIYKLITKNVSRRYAWIGLMIFIVNPYLFLMNLSAIRQCLAMLLFVIAVPYGIKRRFVPYALLVCIGSMFHKTSILLLPIYFLLSSKPFRRRNVLLVLLGLMVMFRLFATNEIVLWIAQQFDDKNYIHYANNALQNSIRATLLTSIYLAYVLLNMNKLEGKKLVYAKLALVGYTMGVLAYQLSMFTRIQMYFDIFTIVAIPTILEQVNGEGKIYINHAKPQETIWKCINRYAFPACIFLIYFLRYYSFFTNSMWTSFFTYQTIFSAP